MAGIRGCCPSAFVSHISALVFILCFVDAEASDGHRQAVIYKKVGDDVELSCFQGTKVSEGYWEYKGYRVAQYDENKTPPISYHKLFKDKVYLNPTNFSLTVQNLTLNDSGEFKLVSFDAEKQRPTGSLTLQVVEALTAPPILTSTSTTLNASCTVVLKCISEAVGRVTYRWSVRNRTTTGPNLTYVIGKEDGDTVFTCTVNNSVSEVTASKVLTCSNRTEEGAEKADLPTELVMAAVFTGCVVTVAVGTALFLCLRRRQKDSLGEQTVYADVSPVPPQNEWQPCSLYDSIDNRDKPVPQSIYDKIQFKYMRETEPSDRMAA